jgi:hypothetical protein
MIKLERTHIGLALLWGVVAIDVAWYLSGTVLYQPPAGYVDRVTACERRLAPIRDQLPRAGIVGYTIVRSRGRGEWARYGRIFTQYTLTPLLVDTARTHHLRLVDGEEGFRIIRENRP